MRNPNWHRDELILALNLYFDKNLSSIDKSNPKIIELSEILNRLPLFPEIPDPEKFRNPNGVALKLSNFKAIDPKYSGKGMSRGGQLDKVVFNDFVEDQERLRKVAAQIEKVAQNPELQAEILGIEDDANTEEDLNKEGKVLYKLHKSRERNKKVVAKKKDSVLKRKNKLECEICSFDFAVVYGKTGYGFIECHHTVPLSQFDAEKKTTIEDLSLLCSNCHRMIHRITPIPSIEEFKLHHFIKLKFLRNDSL